MYVRSFSSSTLLSPRTDAIPAKKMETASPPAVEYLDLAEGRRIAYRHLRADDRGVLGPAIVYVPGYLSTMEIHKATAVENFARQRGLAAVRYDQEGVGKSTGDLRDMLVTYWIEDLLSVMDRVLSGGPAVLVASSMGGWLATYAATVRQKQVAGLVLIGPQMKFPSGHVESAMARKALDEQQMAALEAGAVWQYPTPYGDAFFSAAYLRDSIKYELDLSKPLPVKCPVRILHAFFDAEAEWELSRRLLEAIEAEDVDLLLRKQGNHRLMKPRDLSLLHSTLDDILLNIVGRPYNNNAVATVAISSKL